ncbi:unnamed protein product, partial [Didymodactylos carnosus]
MAKDGFPDTILDESEDEIIVNETQDAVGPIRNKRKTKCQPYPNTASLRRSARIQNKQLSVKADMKLNDTLIYTEEKILISEESKSSIAKHKVDSGHAIDWTNFGLVWRDRNPYCLLLKESLVIQAYKPELNCTTHSVPLIVFPEGLPKNQVFQSQLSCQLANQVPLRGSSIDIHPNAQWQQNGLTVAGGNGRGNGINQLSNPYGLYVDDDQTLYVADQSNHRIVEWKSGATSGQVVAGGNGEGSGAHQLSNPADVIVDKERDSLIISDYSNKRVVRWPRRNGTSGETIISNINCRGLTMDENGSLYVTDYGKAEVRRYRRGESQGTVVAGGNG